MYFIIYSFFKHHIIVYMSVGGSGRTNFLAKSSRTRPIQPGCVYVSTGYRCTHVELKTYKITCISTVGYKGLMVTRIAKQLMILISPKSASRSHNGLLKVVKCYRSTLTIAHIIRPRGPITEFV